MSLTTKEAVKQLLSVIPIKGIALTVLFLIPTISAGLLYNEVRTLNKTVEEVKHDQEQQQIIFSDYKRVVGAFYDEYKETGQLTYETLAATIYELESSIKVYDENVDLYNSQMKDVYERIDNLDKRVKIITDYLSN